MIRVFNRISCSLLLFALFFSQCSKAMEESSGFGVGGYVINNFGMKSRAFTLLVQPDGKLITAGALMNLKNYYDFFLTRYHSNGMPDFSFFDANVPGATNPSVIVTEFDGYSYIFSSALAQDGKVVVAQVM